MVGEDFIQVDGPVVQLNVGGQLFCTSRDTLEASKSLFGRILNGEGATKLKQGDRDVYFLDRDPKHFQRVLNFLRDDKCVIPSDPDECEELLAEAKYYQVHDLAAKVKDKQREHGKQGTALNFRDRVLQHHAEMGKLDECIATVLDFVCRELVKVTPVTDVGDDNKLQVYWLSRSLPPANPTLVAFRYRGDHDIGVTIADTDWTFKHWTQLWDVYYSRQLQYTFKAILLRAGIKVGFKDRIETFKPDTQLDALRKMYRVRCLVLTIAST